MAKSNACILAARKHIQESVRLLLRHVGGGSTDGDGSGAICERLAQLPTARPRVYARPSMGDTRCDICHHLILPGASEYELEFTVLALRLDRACFVTWQRQMVKV